MTFSLKVIPRSTLMMISFWLAGCALHPVQQDVTGLKSVKVVERIRCETRTAIQDKAINQLDKLGDKRVSDYLREDRSRFFEISPATLNTRERIFYDRYIGTAIAYEFTFDIVEDNKAAANVDPILLITRGTVGVGLQGSGEFNRSNVRRFILSEEFGDLLTDRQLDCDAPYNSENFVYPISGSVGIGELIDTFIDLNQGKQLESLEKSSSRVFADTLQFTTTISGSASPHVVLAGLGNQVGLDSGLLSGSAFRIDRHQLIVGLSMGAKSKTAPSLAGLNVAPAKRAQPSGNRERALDAITQQRLNSFYDRFGSVAR